VGSGPTSPSTSGGTLPVTGMGLTLVVVAVIAILAGLAMKAVQR
jgi:Tfp pilus assembly major pilin PilA